MGKATEIVKASDPLPGQLATDTDLVASVAEKVRNAYHEGNLTTLIKVGTIVVDEMFGGDYENFVAGAKAHESFRALAKRADIGISSSQLWYAVNILENVRLIGDGEAQRLGSSHHRLLTHVSDKSKRKQIAERAIARNLTVKELEAEIRSSQVREPDAPKLGRPALPKAIKQLGELERVARSLAPVTDESLAGIDTKEIPEYAARLAGTRPRIEAWLTGVENALGALVLAEKLE